MNIVHATEQDLPVIHELAEKTWWPTYGAILSKEQISFMLANMYSLSALNEQMADGTQFLLIKRDQEDVAFAAYSIEAEQSLLKIHKIYILPSEQGKGTGKQIIDHLSQLARQAGILQLELNVNRANPALGFYQKVGFEIFESVDIPYYQFVLNDYVMRKPV